MMFQTVGHRAHTQQRVRLGATPEGKLVSLQHDYLYHLSMIDHYHEDCGEATPFHYSVPNLRVTFGRARRNIGATADMRGPGAVPGLYATESAMNEMAERLKIDPVAVPPPQRTKDRRIGESPFSSRHYVECLKLGGEIWLVEAQPGYRLDEAR
jgi:xanthine dehydrogenase YagR molybdenum-binding subunit